MEKKMKDIDIDKINKAAELLKEASNCVHSISIRQECIECSLAYESISEEERDDIMKELFKHHRKRNE